MYKFVPFIKYSVNGKVYESGKLNDEHYTLDYTADDSAVKCILHPKTEIELMEFRLTAIRKSSGSEVFFANGYQSWTTTREYSPDDTVNGYIPVAKISDFTKSLAGISGDYHFTNYGEKGRFHSFTYTYFRLGDKLELFGSLNERTGYTIFEVNYPENSFSVIKDVESAKVTGDYELVNVLRFEGGYDEVFDNYFGAMNLRKSKLEHLSGYTSWYNYFQKISEDIILRDLDGLDRAKDSVSVFQIDDGFESAVGDWLEIDEKKFPNGMKPIIDKIHEKGYLAGLWLAPFSAQKSSEIAKEHPDWLIKDNASGKPLLGCVAWGGAYTLDFYNPEAREYIRHFFDVVLNEWNVDLVKLDFLYSECMQPRDGKTRGQIMCEAMDFLRECVGDEKYILGCGVPLGPSFGVVDACRISCDVDLKYTGKYYNKLGVNREIPSARFAMNNSIFRRHLNRRVFCNDPDVFFLRDGNLKFNDEQKLLLAKINNLCGDVLFVSDNAGEYSDEKISLLKKFFKRSDAKILKAEYIGKDSLYIRYTENGGEKTLRFNIATGKSNVESLI
ncbi:MAG: alpha-galactosidase [Clostridia bacterium]|nr:alpha-galactosidase [Clostridia bacterium]